MAKEGLSSDPEYGCYLHFRLKKDHDPFPCQSLMWFKLISLIHMGIDNTVDLLFLAFKVPTAFVWCAFMYS